MNKRAQCHSRTGRRLWQVCLAIAAVVFLPWRPLNLHAAASASANYRITTDSTDSGSAAFAPSYANRSAVESVVGVSGATIPDATTRFLWHGFVPQLDAPLFAVADVAVSVAANPVLCSPGEPVTFSGSVTNQSPEDAPGVVLTLSMPTNAAFVLATAGQGSAALTNNTLRYTMGAIPAGAVVPYSLQVTATSTGLALVTASVTVEAVDGNFANNSASAESLVVLTIYSVGSAIGGWFNAANWSPAIVPTTNHRAVVDGEIMDFYTADATVAGLVLTGGRIAGAHRLTVTKLAEWSGGELQSGFTLAIAPGGFLRVTNGSGALTLRTGSGIENRGTLRLESTALQSVFGAWVTNYGLFEVAGQRSFLRFEDAAFDFSNQAGAVFRRSSGAGTNRVVAAFHNEGMVENLTGVLDFGATFINGGWALVNTGTLRTASGSEIRYTRANNFRHGTTFEGPGTHRLLAATAGPNDGSQFAGDIHGDFTVAYGWMGGTFTNTGQVIWEGGDFRSGGTWTIAPGGVATLTGLGARTLVNGYLLRNLGTLRLAGTSLGASSGGTADNLGLLDIAGDYGVQSTVVLSNRATGILRKSAGTGSSTITSSFYQAGGTVDIWTGTLALAGGYSPSPTSALRIVIGGTVPDTQFGRLTAAGSAVLNGTLLVALTNGFVPAPADTFQFLTAASRTGSFISYSAPPPGNGHVLLPEYLANAARLKMIPGAVNILSSSVVHTNGQLRFSYQAGVGGTYVIEATPILGPGTAWQPVATNVAYAPLMEFVDEDTAIHPSRFYRVGFRP